MSVRMILWMHRAINYGLYGAMQAHRGNGI